MQSEAQASDDEQGEEEMEEPEQGESEMEEGEEQEEEPSHKSSEQVESSESSSSEEEGGDKDISLKGWKSLLLKDGIGPFLQPLVLQDAVSGVMTKHGLSAEGVESDALGFLLDSVEYYMKELVQKCVLKARVRM